MVGLGRINLVGFFGQLESNLPQLSLPFLLILVTESLVQATLTVFFKSTDYRIRLFVSVLELDYLDQNPVCFLLFV